MDLLIRVLMCDKSTSIVKPALCKVTCLLWQFSGENTENCLFDAHSQIDVHPFFGLQVAITNLYLCCIIAAADKMWVIFFK